MSVAYGALDCFFHRAQSSISRSIETLTSLACFLVEVLEATLHQCKVQYCAFTLVLWQSWIIRVTLACE